MMKDSQFDIVQFQTISMLPPPKGLVRGSCKANKFKEMYEA